MEMHHKLRRDPTWHKDGCNICGQLGHQARDCTSGTVNWRQIYGDKAFVLRPVVFWSEEVAAKKARTPDVVALEKRAREYAKAQASREGLDYDEIIKKGEELHNQDPSVTIQKVENPPEDLPTGWASAQDPQGRTYYFHKATLKTTWEKPTEDTATA